MSASVTLRIDGASQLARKLERSANVLGERVDEACLRSAVRVLERARANAPVKSGRLRDNLTIRKETLGVYTVLGDLPYTRRIELGFTGTDSLGRTYNQPGVFFLLRAADASRAGHASEVGKALAQTLREA